MAAHKIHSFSSSTASGTTVVQDLDPPEWDRINYLIAYNNQVHAEVTQMQPYRLQLKSPKQGQIPTGGENVGQGLGDHTGAPGPRIQIECKIFRPQSADDEPIELRRENRVVLGFIIAKLNNAGLPWSCIKLLNIGPAEHSRIPRGESRLYLTLEVHGATTGTHLVSACRKCSRKVSSASPSSSLFEFVAKDGLIGITGGKAEVAFRFRCLPRHHETADTEYRLTAVISDGTRILSQHTFTNWFRVVHHLTRKRNRPPAVPPGPIEMPSVMSSSGDSEESLDVSPDAHILDGSSGTSAGDSCCPIPLWEGSGLPAPTARNIKPVHESLPVLSHMNPRRGPLKGEIEIYLVVRNLLPTAVLYVRFGYNIAPTSHVAHGVLSCVLPATTHPGVVDVTLCQAPSVHEEGYGTSLVSFKYESDTSSETLVASWWNGHYGSHDVGPGITAA